jgi:hypothetical protein
VAVVAGTEEEMQDHKAVPVEVAALRMFVLAEWLLETELLLRVEEEEPDVVVNKPERAVD